jgi:hypothetical protein
MRLAQYFLRLAPPVIESGNTLSSGVSNPSLTMLVLPCPSVNTQYMCFFDIRIKTSILVFLVLCLQIPIKPLKQKQKTAFWPISFLSI